MQTYRSDDSQYREVFAIFDKTKSGNIDLGNLATAMRLLGQNPTESELKLIQESILRNRNGAMVSYQDFANIMRQYSKPRDAQEKLLVQAFATFDGSSSGFLRKEDLRNVLGSLLGDTIMSSEIEEMLRTAPVDAQDRVDYRAFAQLLLT
jgi:calmodulin